MFFFEKSGKSTVADQGGVKRVEARAVPHVVEGHAIDHQDQGE